LTIKNWKARNLLGIGEVISSRHVSAALKNLLAALRISEEIDDKDQMASVYLSIGDIYSRESQL